MAGVDWAAAGETGLECGALAEHEGCHLRGAERESHDAAAARLEPAACSIVVN